MKVFLALMCFLVMMLQAFFGLYLYNKGENIFYPEQLQMSLMAQGEKTPKATEMVPPSEGTMTTDTVTTEIPKVDLKQEHNISSDSQAALTITENFQAPTPKLINPAFDTGWAGFLQVENAVITFLLFILGFAVCCVKGRGAASRWVFGFNLVFWSALTGAIWFFHPVNTPLNILRMTFKFPQWYFIIAMSGLAALVSFILFVNAFRKPSDKPAKKSDLKREELLVKDKSEKTPVTESKEIADKSESKVEKKSRFGFGFGNESKESKSTDINSIKSPTVSPVEKDLSAKPEKEEPSVESNDSNFVEVKEGFEKPLEKPLKLQEQEKVAPVKEPGTKETTETGEKPKEEAKKEEPSVIIVPPAPKKEPKF